MIGNITEEQFKKFCKDFVEKYEGRNFKELVKSLGEDWNVCFKGIITKDLKFVARVFGLTFRDLENQKPVFCHHTKYNYVFVDAYGNSINFSTIEDLYKFFKMNEKENKETIEITLEVNLEDILKMYKEDISKKLGMSSDNIKINLKRG